VVLRRHPMVIYLHGLVAASGLAYLLGPHPHSVDQLLPDGLSYLWYLSLAAGGVMGLVSAAWRDPLAGVLIERAAMLPLGGAALVYAVALLTLANLALLLNAGLIAGFGAAAILRALQITREVRAAGGAP
jgi:hypothetical protein